MLINNIYFNNKTGFINFFQDIVIILFLGPIRGLIRKSSVPDKENPNYVILIFDITFRVRSASTRHLMNT